MRRLMLRLLDWLVYGPDTWHVIDWLDTRAANRCNGPEDET